VTPRTRSGQPERDRRRRRKTLAGCLDLATTKSSEFAANHPVVVIEKIAPTAVAKRGRSFRRADDVREEHCSENAVGLDGVTHARQKLLDLSEDRVRVTEPWKVVLPRQFDEPRPRNPLRHISARADGIVASRTLWSSNVGTRIAGRMCRISISSFIATSAITAAGLAPILSSRAHHRENRSSPTILGAHGEAEGRVAFARSTPGALL
jgi:hypothetical protein